MLAVLANFTGRLFPSRYTCLLEQCSHGEFLFGSILQFNQFYTFLSTSPYCQRTLNRIAKMNRDWIENSLIRCKKELNLIDLHTKHTAAVQFCQCWNANAFALVKMTKHKNMCV